MSNAVQIEQEPSGTPLSPPRRFRPPRLLPQMLVLAAGALMATGQMYLPLPLLSLIGGSTGTTVSVASWTVTAFGAGYALGFLALGPLGPRVGYRRMIAIGLAASAALTAVTAIMPTFELVIASRVAQGFAAASFGPAAMSYITRRFPARHRALAFTVLTSSYLASAVLAQIGAQAVADVWNWRAAFVATAVLVAVVAALVRVVLRHDPPDRGSRPTAAYQAMLAAAVTPRLVPFFLAALTVLFGYVGLYAAIQLTDPLGVAASPAELLALRASALPAVVLAPVLMYPFGRIRPAHRIAISGALTTLLIAAAAASVPVTASVTVFTLLLGGFVLGIGLLAPSVLHALSENVSDNISGATAMYGFWMFIGSSASAPVVAGLSGLGFVGLGGMFAVVFLGAAATGLLTRRG